MDNCSNHGDIYTEMDRLSTTSSALEKGRKGYLLNDKLQQRMLSMPNDVTMSVTNHSISSNKKLPHENTSNDYISDRSLTNLFSANKLSSKCIDNKFLLQKEHNFINNLEPIYENQSQSSNDFKLTEEDLNGIDTNIGSSNDNMMCLSDQIKPHSDMMDIQNYNQTKSSNDITDVQSDIGEIKNEVHDLKRDLQILNESKTLSKQRLNKYLGINEQQPQINQQPSKVQSLQKQNYMLKCVIISSLIFITLGGAYVINKSIKKIKTN